MLKSSSQKFKLRCLVACLPCKRFRLFLGWKCRRGFEEEVDGVHSQVEEECSYMLKSSVKNREECGKSGTFVFQGSFGRPSRGGGVRRRALQA